MCGHTMWDKIFGNSRKRVVEGLVAARARSPSFIALAPLRYVEPYKVALKFIAFAVATY